MTDIEIKEVADLFLGKGDTLHAFIAISIVEVLELAKEVQDSGFNLDLYCKEILILRSCNSISEIESVVKKWIESDGLLVESTKFVQSAFSRGKATTLSEEQVDSFSTIGQ